MKNFCLVNNFVAIQKDKITDAFTACITFRDPSVNCNKVYFIAYPRLESFLRFSGKKKKSYSLIICASKYLVSI